MRPAQLEREWIADLSSRNRLFPVLVGGGIAWTLAALLLPLAYLRRRRRARAKLADMAKRETEERAERLRELLETLRARQSLWVVAPGELTATPLAVGRSPADSADTATDADETTGGTAASQSRGIARSDGGLPVVRIGDETHTLH